MATIDGLSVRVSAATSQFTTGMSRAQDAAQDVSLSLRRLGAAASSAERDIDSAGRSAASSSTGMLAFGASTEGAGFAVRGLSGSILLSLVPALGTLLAALTPVVAALGGFVAIAGAITGVGLVSIIGGIATNTEMLKETFGTLVETIKTEFAPMFDLAAAVLDTLMWQLTQVIPALTPADDLLSRLAGNFAHLGGAIIDMLPAFADLIYALTTEFLPPFVTWADDFLPEVPGMIMNLVDAFRRVMPFFSDLGHFLGRLLPELMDFGYTALPVVADALGTLGWAMTTTLQQINSLGNGVGSLVAELSLIAPVATTLISLLGGPLTAAVAGMAAVAVAAATAWETNFAGIQNVVSKLNSHIQTIMPQLRAAVDAFFDGFEFSAIDAAAGRFEATLSGELMKTLRALRPLITQIGNALQRNEEEIEALGWATSRLIALSIDLANVMAQVLGPQIRQRIREFRVLVIILEEALQALGNFAGAAEQIDQGNFQAAANILAEREQDAPVAEQLTGLERTLTDQDSTPAEVNVTVEGDTDVVRNVSAEVVQSENRTTRRRQGRALDPS